MPYITAEDMKPGMKLLMTDIAEIIAEQHDTTAESVLYPHQNGLSLGPRARQATVVSATAGMNTELQFDGVSYAVELKVPGRRATVTVHLGADWLIRTPLSTTY